MERTPLQSKAVNIFGTPVKRSSPTKLGGSPSKKQRAFGAARTPSVASFNIFADPTDYRDENAGLVPRKLDLGPGVDKENGESVREAVVRKQTRVLEDLPITLHPGFVSSGQEGPLAAKTQLREPWYSNRYSGESGGRLAVPSYVTPPKRDRIRHYQFVDSMDRRSSSLDEVVADTAVQGLARAQVVDDLALASGRVCRQLDFIHSDTLD